MLNCAEPITGTARPLCVVFHVQLTVLSKSSLGQQVQDKLNERLPQLQAEAAALRQQHAGGSMGGLRQPWCRCCTIQPGSGVWRWAIFYQLDDGR